MKHSSSNQQYHTTIMARNTQPLLLTMSDLEGVLCLYYGPHSPHWEQRWEQVCVWLLLESFQSSIHSSLTHVWGGVCHEIVQFESGQALLHQPCKGRMKSKETCIADGERCICSASFTGKLLVANVQGLQVALNRKFTIYYGVFRTEVWLVEVVCMLHVDCTQTCTMKGNGINGAA